MRPHATTSSKSPCPSRARRLRRGLVAVAMTAGVLVVPVGLVSTAPTASAAPCLPAPLPCLLPPAATTPPAIPATAKVGQTLTVTPPVWDQPAVTTTYQWTRDGDDIAGATLASYTLTGDDFDASIVVVATGTTAGALLPGTSDSNAVQPDKGDPITATTAPVVSGSAAPGGTLTTTTGTWGEPEPLFTYQWARSRPYGNPGVEVIQGATSASYSPVAADAGRRLAVVVYADRVGYEKGAAISNVVTAPKTSSRAVLTLLKKTVRRTQQPSVRVTLLSGAGIIPTGTIVVVDGSRPVKTVKLGSAAQGVVTFKLPKLSRGTHLLKARYGGDAGHLASSSAAQLLTVTR